MWLYGNQPDSPQVQPGWAGFLVWPTGSDPLWRFYLYPYPVNARIPRQNGDRFKQYPRGQIYLPSLVGMAMGPGGTSFVIRYPSPSKKFILILISKRNGYQTFAPSPEAEQGCDIGEPGLPQPFLFFAFFVI